jgi:hypothetical protein
MAHRGIVWVPLDVSHPSETWIQVVSGGPRCGASCSDFLMRCAGCWQLRQPMLRRHSGRLRIFISLRPSSCCARHRHWHRNWPRSKAPGRRWHARVRRLRRTRPSFRRVLVSSGWSGCCGMCVPPRRGDAGLPRLAIVPMTSCAWRKPSRRATRACFDEELSDNRLRTAGACLDAWQALAPGDDGLHAARRRLAPRWMAVASERLGAGDADFASQALEQVRQLDAMVPGVEDFARRVRDAHAAGP